MTDSEVTRFMKAGNFERLIEEVLSEPDLDRAFLSFRSQIRQTVEDSYTVSIRDLPKAGRIDGVPAVAFDHLAENVRTAIQKLETPVLTSLKDDVQQTVRQAVARGLEEGKAPKTVAREIRSVIGLGKGQVEQVANFRDALEGKNGRSLGDYALRDKRLDKMLARGPLTDEQVDRAVDAYTKRRIAQNANTVSRTATMDAYRLGQNEAWRDAQDNGVIPPGMELWKTWVQIDRPTMREEHIPLDGETVPFDEPYSNGSMIPGDQGEYNCFPGDTVVEGAFVGGLKAAYSGPLREIKTARGHCLRVTPNHPVLTAQGWVSAHALREGDAVLSDSGNIDRRSLRVGSVYDQQRPVIVEQVFDALSAHGTGTSRRASRQDLHGDAPFTDGEINIVWADADLLNESAVGPFDSFDDWTLHAPDVNKAALPRRGSFDLHGERIALAASGRVGRSDLTMGDGGVALESFPLQTAGVGRAAHWHTALGEASKQETATVPAFARELLQASAGAIAFDEVVEVRDITISGHVYDLHAVDGWILAQGIVISNCGCLSRVFMKRAA